jgi:uncharacterized membrane protein YtjA (UPF0391 family)
MQFEIFGRRLFYIARLGLRNVGVVVDEVAERRQRNPRSIDFLARALHRQKGGFGNDCEGDADQHDQQRPPAKPGQTHQHAVGEPLGAAGGRTRIARRARQPRGNAGAALAGRRFLLSGVRHVRRPACDADDSLPQHPGLFCCHAQERPGSPGKRDLSSKEAVMLRYILIFFIVALIAAFFGFANIAANAAAIAKILFFVFLALTIASFLLDRLKRPGR